MAPAVFPLTRMPLPKEFCHVNSLSLATPHGSLTSHFGANVLPVSPQLLAFFYLFPQHSVVTFVMLYNYLLCIHLSLLLACAFFMGNNYFYLFASSDYLV